MDEDGPLSPTAQSQTLCSSLTEDFGKMNILFLPIFPTANRDHNSTDFIELLGVFHKLTYGMYLVQCLEHGKMI